MMHVVWFKKDLRIYDHQPLVEAASKGPVLALYVVEPAYWELADTSKRQWTFMRTCLQELDKTLRQYGGRLVIRIGAVPDVLDALHKERGIQALYSHEETGNHWTYKRDIAVRNWCESHDIKWREYRQFGVIRRLKNRDGWASQWDAFMAKPCAPVPENMRFAQADSTPLPTGEALSLKDCGLTHPQPAGRAEGLKALQSFLYQRGRTYQKDMSSPVSGEVACSRLSPYITYGCLSVREIWQALQRRMDDLKTESKTPERTQWLRSLNAFNGRLHWHCHFVQKLESQPQIEFRDILHATQNLRGDDFNPDWFKAWSEGKTGYPFVDACMRYVRATGWLNFRMRAMLVSFASYNLWLDWRKTAPHLARMFTDYEPGIHYSQFQMQSGTTGINTIRVYNPIKQSEDQDPEGVFIRTWVPELAHVAKEWIHQPWLMPETLQKEYSCRIDVDYPAPIVEQKTSAKFAKDQIFAARKSAEAQKQKGKILKKHASRKPTRTRQSKQLALDL